MKALYRLLFVNQTPILRGRYTGMLWSMKPPCIVYRFRYWLSTWTR